MITLITLDHIKYHTKREYYHLLDGVLSLACSNLPLTKMPRKMGTLRNGEKYHLGKKVVTSKKVRIPAVGPSLLQNLKFCLCGSFVGDFKACIRVCSILLRYINRLKNTTVKYNIEALCTKTIIQ